MLAGSSNLTLHIPRDQSGIFDTKLIAKYERRFPDFDDKIMPRADHEMTGVTPSGDCSAATIAPVAAVAAFAALGTRIGQRVLSALAGDLVVVAQRG